MDGKRFAVDAAALAVYLAVANPAFTGIAVHEWVSAGLFVAFLAHCAQHADWIAETVRAAAGRRSPARIAHLVLDALVLAAFMVATVSGLLISGAVLPAFGLYADGYYFWDPLHSISAKALLALLLVHVVAHWRQLYNFARKMKGAESNGHGKRAGKERSDD